MRILIITPIFPPSIGGPATYVWEIANYLKKNHQVTIICFSSSPKTISNVTIIPIKESGNTLSRQYNLLKNVILQAKLADSIYIQGTIVVGFVSAIASKLLNKKSLLKFVGDEVWETARSSQQNIGNFHDFYSQPLQPKWTVLNLIQQISLKLAQRIIVPSSYLKSFLMTFHKVNQNKISIINNAVSASILPIKKLKHQLIYVGRLVAWKNIDQIITATANARNKAPWKLHIIGDGPEETKLKKLVKQLKAESWVTFRGNLSHDKTLKEIAQSGKLILYSDYEGLSHTLIEAMLLKTGIIASDIQANREVLGSHGKLVKLGNLTALTNAINQPSQRLNKAQQFAKTNYNWDKHIFNLSKLL